MSGSEQGECEWRQRHGEKGSREAPYRLCHVDPCSEKVSGLAMAITTGTNGHSDKRSERLGGPKPPT